MKTKKQLIELFVALTSAKTKGGAKFKYNVLKNLKVIEPEVEPLRIIETEISDVLKGYNEARNAIITKYGKEVNGVLSIQPADEKYKEAVAEIKELETTFKADIELHTAKTKEYSELLDSAIDNEFSFLEISPDNLPDDITDVEMEQLMEWEIVK